MGFDPCEPEAITMQLDLLYPNKWKAPFWAYYIRLAYHLEGYNTLIGHLKTRHIHPRAFIALMD